MKSFRLNRGLWLITSLLATGAAAFGVFNLDAYRGLVAEGILPGVFTQDVVVLLASLLLVGLAARTGEHDLRKQTLGLGLLGFYFYAYGIYAIEQVYTPIYPAYLAVLGLSFYGLILGFASIQWRSLRTRMPAGLRLISGAFAILIAVMFNILWLSQLVPLLQAGDRIEYTFSIIIIDLSFVMPGFLISAVMSLKGRALGTVGLFALFALGVGILAPLALAEALKPAVFNLPTDPAQLGLYVALTLSFTVLLLWGGARVEVEWSGQKG